MREHSGDEFVDLCHEIDKGPHAPNSYTDGDEYDVQCEVYAQLTFETQDWGVIEIERVEDGNEQLKRRAT